MSGWQIDKHIPAALILAIVVQTGAFVWWAATLTSRVDALEAWRTTQGDLVVRIVEQETHLLHIRQSLDRLQSTIDRQERQGR